MILSEFTQVVDRLGFKQVPSNTGELIYIISDGEGVITIKLIDDIRVLLYRETQDAKRLNLAFRYKVETAE